MCVSYMKRMAKTKTNYSKENASGIVIGYEKMKGC